MTVSDTDPIADTRRRNGDKQVAIDETGRVKVIARDGSFEYLPDRYCAPVPIFRKTLSLDAMIGLGVLFAIFAYSGFSPVLFLWACGIALLIWAYAWLTRHAPVTAAIIGLLLMSILLALLNARSGRRRRW